jgi:hypothetical protein
MDHASLALRLNQAEQDLRRTEGQIERQHNWISKLDLGGRTSVAEREVLNTLHASHGTFVIVRDRLLERMAH